MSLIHYTPTAGLTCLENTCSSLRRAWIAEVTITDLWSTKKNCLRLHSAIFATILTDYKSFCCCCCHRVKPDLGPISFYPRSHWEHIFHSTVCGVPSWAGLDLHTPQAAASVVLDLYTLHAAASVVLDLHTLHAAATVCACWWKTPWQPLCCGVRHILKGGMETREKNCLCDIPTNAPGKRWWKKTDRRVKRISTWITNDLKKKEKKRKIENSHNPKFWVMHCLALVFLFSK